MRRGESHGYVAIWLSQGRPGQSICIKRILSAKDNSSEWRINGEAQCIQSLDAAHTRGRRLARQTRWVVGAAAQLKDVKERVKSMNIQLDNLCQVLYRHWNLSLPPTRTKPML